MMLAVNLLRSSGMRPMLTPTIRNSVCKVASTSVSASISTQKRLFSVSYDNMEENPAREVTWIRKSKGRRPRRKEQNSTRPKVDEVIKVTPVIPGTKVIVPEKSSSPELEFKFRRSNRTLSNKAIEELNKAYEGGSQDVVVHPDTKFIVPTSQVDIKDMIPDGYRRNRLMRERIVDNKIIKSPVISYASQPLNKKFVNCFLKSLSGHRNIGIMQLNRRIFGAMPRNDIMELAVRYERSWLIDGTESTKRRDEVRGGGRKPWRQKGTGRARHGSIRSPIWIGGGKVHGKRPHLQTIDINRKVYDAALCSAIASKYHQGQLIVVDSLEEPVTDLLAALRGSAYSEKDDVHPKEVLAAMSVDEGIGIDKSAYFIYGSPQPPIWLISELNRISPPISKKDRFKKVKFYDYLVSSIKNILVQPILDHEFLVLDKRAVEMLEGNYGKEDFSEQALKEE